MAKKKWPFKDPDEQLDYTIDWYGTADIPGRLYGTTDTIASSTWDVPDGLTVDPDHPPSFTDTTTTIWLIEGVIGKRYPVTNHIVTDGERKMDQTVWLPVKMK